MATTSGFISQIARGDSNFSRSQILDYLNDVLVIVFGANMAQTLALDTTGQPPYLPTTQGQFLYEAPDNCREIVVVGIDAGVTFGNDYRYGVPVVGYGGEVTLNNRIYRKIPASTRNATPAGNATILFSDDPGTNAAIYRIVYYTKAPQLETEDDPIPLPEELFYDLKKAVLAMMNTVNYGDTDFDKNVIEETCLAIRKKMNHGEQARVGRTGIQIQDVSQYTMCTQGYGRRRI